MAGLRSGFSLRAFPPSSLPMTVAGRLEFVMTLLVGFPVYDDDGEPTGEYTGPMISEETARNLLEGA